MIRSVLPPGSVAIEKGKRRAPRVPFYVARNVTEATAKRLIARLEAAGFDAVMRSGWALSSPGMRKKLWTMTARQTAGAGLVVYMGPNLLPAIVGPSMIPYAMFWWIPLVLACWAGSFAASGTLAVDGARTVELAPFKMASPNGGARSFRRWRSVVTSTRSSRSTVHPATSPDLGTRCIAPGPLP